MLSITSGLLAGRAEAIQADVSAPAQVAALFDQAATQFGAVDVLVNNAGVMQTGLVPLSETDDALFDRIVDTNLKGTFNTLRVAAKKVRAGGRHWLVWRWKWMNAYRTFLLLKKDEAATSRRKKL